MNISIKFFNNIIISISLLLYLSACSHKSRQENDPFEPEYIEKLQTKVLNDTFEFGSPNRILVYDSLLIVYDDLHPNKLHFFDKRDGTYLWEFGRLGQGDKELVTPAGMTLNLSSDLLSVYDYAKRSLLACRLEDLGNFKSEDWFEIPIPEYQVVPKEIVPIGESRYLSIHGKPRLTLRSDSVKYEYDTYPDALDEESKRMFMLSESLSNISPDGGKMVQATSLGLLMDFFEITENEIKLVAENNYVAPIYEMQKGQIALTPESLFGFSCLSSTDNHLYTTFHGKVRPSEYPSDIYKYDWNGNLKEKYETGKQIVSFGVDNKTEEIYAIYMDDDNDQILAKLEK